jgi:hypothetical protein
MPIFPRNLRKCLIWRIGEAGKDRCSRLNCSKTLVVPCSERATCIEIGATGGSGNRLADLVGERISLKGIEEAVVPRREGLRMR